MIRLRLVEEYRGRRIVTNGKLYGVQGELVTDCRYLNVLGAKAAINSEAAIELRRTQRAWQEQLMPQAGYFDNYKRRTFECECGWRGSYKKLTEESGAVDILSCPRCARRLLFVMYPGDEDIKSAAARGNREARAMMQGLRERERQEAARAYQALTKRSQLPTLDGDALEFVWDLVRDGDDNYYVITAAELHVWRERARVEDWERFNPVKQLLKKKYGTRFVRLTLTDAAEKNLRGGYWGWKFSPT